MGEERHPREQHAQHGTGCCPRPTGSQGSAHTGGSRAASCSARRQQCKPGMKSVADKPSRQPHHHSQHPLGPLGPRLPHPQTPAGSPCQSAGGQGAAASKRVRMRHPQGCAAWASGRRCRPVFTAVQSVALHTYSAAQSFHPCCAGRALSLHPLAWPMRVLHAEGPAQKQRME